MLSFSMSEVCMVAGFLLSAYAIVANDAIQTLGTFIAANRQRPWWQLWFFASGILTVVLVYGWIMNGGDPAYGRLERFPYLEGSYSLLHVIPPIALLILTRAGYPVSTTFLILTFFSAKALKPMVIKSLCGYVLALGAGYLLFLLIRRYAERLFEPRAAGEEESRGWLIFQWLSTGFLWTQWLIQDLANVFVYLPHHPERLPVEWLIFGLLAMSIMQIFIFRAGGGKIQEIVDQKSNSEDVRQAALINLCYGAVILFFKEYSKLPMSTTWVFLGLLAGRELAITSLNTETRGAVLRKLGEDLRRATIGLLVSAALAIGLPWLFS